MSGFYDQDVFLHAHSLIGGDQATTYHSQYVIRHAVVVERKTPNI